jgi:flagellar motor switch protein FliM
MDRVLSQDEIDKVFRNLQEDDPDDIARRAQLYDFRRPDRIAKDQLRAIHVLHETFGRSLASSLSAYLRAYVIVNLVSVEQLSFSEFLHCLASPSVITSLSMRPFEGSAVLEMNPGLVFPIVEMLLGGSGPGGYTKLEREITEIEQSILEGVYRIILRDLKEAWESVTPLEFAIERHETEPQMLQILAPNEAVVAVGVEVRIGEMVGMMNIGIPSITIKMLRQKFDQQWSVRKSESTNEERERMLRLIRPAVVEMDVRLDGATVATDDLLKLEVGDILRLDFNIERPLQMKINGREKFCGQVVDTGRKRGFYIDALLDDGRRGAAASR